MTTITFNTGRAYSTNGQKIKVTFKGAYAYFTDYARTIAGKITLEDWEPRDSDIVMLHYDRNNYAMWHGKHEAI